MRNLREFPITWEEKEAWLQEKLDEIEDVPFQYRGVGDLTELVIKEIIEDVGRLRDLVES